VKGFYLSSSQCCLDRKGMKINYTHLMDFLIDCVALKFSVEMSNKSAVCHVPNFYISSKKIKKIVD